jgi:hypothetical protein
MPHAHRYTAQRTRTRTRTRAYTCARVHMRTHTNTCARTHTLAHTRAYTCARTHTHAHAHIHTRTRAHTFAQVHAHTRTHTHMHMLNCRFTNLDPHILTCSLKIRVPVPFLVLVQGQILFLQSVCIVSYLMSYSDARLYFQPAQLNNIGEGE